MDLSQDDLQHMLTASYDALAAFGKDSYDRLGRGVTRVSLPDDAALDALVLTNMVYHTLAELQQLAAPLTGSVRDQMATLLRMVETYDPETQIVVTIGGAGANVLSVKIRLNPPPLVEGPDTVQ